MTKMSFTHTHTHSGFIKAHNPDEHNIELEKATAHLVHVVVPNFGPDLAKMIAQVYEE